MIISRLKGDLGNQMCQYAFGRLLAEQKGYKLQLDETDDGWKNILPDFFPNYTLVEGKENRYNPIFIGPNIHYVNLDTLFNHDGLIFLHGFWQKHYFYTPHIDKIKKWFWYDDSTHDKPNINDVVIHCRLAKLHEHKIKPPIQTFINIVNTLTVPYRKCIVVTDEINHPILNEFNCLKNIEIRSRSRMEDLTFMRYAKRLILSQSSFSWWACMLGNQDIVYAPLTINPNQPHYWLADPRLIEDTDFIPNEQKYIKFYI